MTAPHGMGPPVRRSKYGAAHCWWCQHCDVAVDAAMAIIAKCPICGAGPSSANVIHFHSKRERSHWAMLRLRVGIGEIAILQRQTSYPISIDGTKVGTYKADFTYMENGQLNVEDVKGIDTPLSRFKRKCVEAQYGVEIRIVR